MTLITRSLLIFILVLAFLLPLHSNILAAGEDEENDTSEDYERTLEDNLLEALTASGLLVVIGLVATLVIWKGMKNRNMDQKKWLRNSILLGMAAPVVLIFVLFITMGGRICGIFLILLSMLPAVVLILLFRKAKERSVPMIEFFPDEFVIKTTKLYMMYLTVGIFAVGVTLLLLSFYFIAREWGYWIDMAELVGAIGIPAIFLILAGYFLYVHWVIPNEIKINRYEISRKKGKETEKIKWEDVKEITLKDELLRHRRGATSTEYKVIEVEGKEAKFRFTNIEIPGEEDLRIIVLALLYNMKRSESVVKLNIESVWGRSWYDGFMVQIKKRLGE